MTDAAIEACNLGKDLVSSFLRKRVVVLGGLDLVVPKYQTYGLLGPNGAGKTTTLKLFLGLIRPTTGSATVLGFPAGDRRALSRIGFLPENPYFYSYLSGREFLDLAGRLFGLDGKTRRERLAYLLDIVGLQGAAADLPMRKYSKGMLQRLGIAQSLINDPDVLFLDEPMSGLDPIGRRDVRRILSRLAEEKKTIFFSSHMLADVAEVCHRIGVLNKGALVGEQDVAQIAPTGNYKELEEYFFSVVYESDRPKTA